VDLLVVRDEKGVDGRPMEFINLPPEVRAPDLRSIGGIEEVQESIVGADENARFRRDDEVHLLFQTLFPRDFSGVEVDGGDVPFISAAVGVIPLDEVDGGGGGKGGEK
jgi:hypothetical protein